MILEGRPVKEIVVFGNGKDTELTLVGKGENLPYYQITARDPAIEIEIDVGGRTAHVEVPGIGSSSAQPIIDPNSGEEFRVSFGLPNGFQLTEAEVGSGRTDLTAGIELHLSDSHAHFAELHMNQDGVIR